jgi:hypothetical protein
VSLLYPQGRQLSPRVRVFIDWAAKIFASQKCDPAGDTLRQTIYFRRNSVSPGSCPPV